MEKNIFVYIFLIIAALGIFALLNHLRKVFKLLPDGFAKATGAIKDYARHERYETLAYPIISFKVDAIEYTFTDKHAVPNSIHRKKSGKTVTLYYNKSNPKEAYVNTPLLSFGLFSALLLLVFSFSMLSILYWETVRPTLNEWFSADLADETLILIISMSVLFLFVAFACFFLIYQKKNYVRTTGVITGFQKRRRFRSGYEYYYYPTIKFYVGSQEIEFTDNEFAILKKPKVGQTIKILYNPHNPKEAVAQKWFVYIFPIAFLIFLGVALLVF